MNQHIPKYFNVPTQVKFLDYDYEFAQGETEEDRPFLGGIAYQDYVICGCCGGVSKIEELRNIDWLDLNFTEFDWINLSGEIIGG